MNKILVVFTGGTIGATAKNGVIDIEKNNKDYKLISLYKQQYALDNIKFKTIEPVNILSENLNPKAWTSIIESIEQENLKEYNGIILTHGTDTLAYTSSLLSVYFNSLEIPLILVSSDFTLEKKSANGLINFDTAIKLIEKGNEKGVFVSYMNSGENPKIHFGSKLMTSLPLDCYFASVKNSSYMEYRDNQFIITDSSIPDIEINKSLQPVFSDKVLLIKPYPGLNYDMYNLSNIDIIIHDLYHSGTACTTNQWGDNYSLIEFLGKCKAEEIKVYLAPIESNDEAYQSTQELIEAGAEIVFDETIEMVYAKHIFKHIKCCENVTSLIELKKLKKCKIITVYGKDKNKALISSNHIDQQGHYNYYFIDCSDKECMCFHIDYRLQVLYPELYLKITTSINENNSKKSSLVPGQ